MLKLSFFCNLYQGLQIVSIIGKIASKKIGDLIRFIKSLSLEVVLYLCKSIIRHCLKYCCHVWDGALTRCLDMLDKLQKRLNTTVFPILAVSPQLLVHRRIATVSLFYRYYFDRCSPELGELAPLPYYRGRLNCYSERLHYFSAIMLLCSPLSWTL